MFGGPDASAGPLGVRGPCQPVGGDDHDDDDDDDDELRPRGPKWRLKWIELLFELCFKC